MGNQINLNLITDYMLENKLSKKEFCKLAGISDSVLKKILNNQTNFRINCLIKICKLLKVGFYDFFKAD